MQIIINLFKNAYQKGVLSRILTVFAWTPLFISFIFYVSAPDGAFYPTISERIIPYGIPPIMSLLIYLSLATLCFQSGRRQLTTLLFGLYCMLWGFLNIDNTLGFMVMQESLALQINRIDHFFLVFQPALGMHFIYSTIGRRNRLLVGLLYACGFVLMPLTQTDHYFHSAMYHYAWGFCARGSWALEVFSVIGTSALLWSSFLLFRSWRKEADQIKKKQLFYIFFGIILSSILTICDFPSMNGIEVYPTSTFAFIPMLIAAYGVLRYDMIRIDRYTKVRILAIVVKVVIITGLISLIIVGFWALKGYTWQHIAGRMAPYGIPPILSFLFCGLLTILSFRIGENNKESLIFGILCLFYSFLTFDISLNGIITDAGVGLWLSRTSHTFFVFTPVLFIQLVHLVTGTRKWKPLVYACLLLSVFLSLFTHSGFYLQGMYAYFWGFFARKAVLFDVLSVYGFLTTCYCFVMLLISYRRSVDPFQKHRRFYLLLGISSTAVFSLSNIPALNGYEIYPLGNFVFIPFLFFAYGMFRYNLKEVAHLLHSFLYYAGLLAGIAGIYYLDTYLVPALMKDFTGIAGSILLFLLFRKVWKVLLNSIFTDHANLLRRVYEELVVSLSKRHGLKDIADVLSGIFGAHLLSKTSLMLFYEERSHAYLASEYWTGNAGMDPAGMPEVQGMDVPQIAGDNPLLGIFNSRSGAIKQNNLEEWILNNDLRWETDDLLRSAHVIQPVYYEDRLVMLILLDGKKDSTVYAKEELDFLYQLGLSLGSYVENAFMLQELELKVEERTKSLRESEEKLRDSEEKYRSLLDVGVIGYYEIDLTGTFTFSNQSICDFVGYTYDEMIGMDFKKVTVKEDHARLIAVFTDVFLGTVPLGVMIIKHPRRDGEIKHAQHYISAMKNVTGETVGFRCVGVDISDRIKAEEALRASEEKYRDFIETLPVIVFEVNGQGIITYINSTGLELYGYAREEVINKPAGNFIAAAEHGALYHGIDRITGEGKTYKNVHYHAIRKDGSLMPAHLSTSHMRGKEEGGGFQGILVDLTQIEEAQQALRESEEKYRMIMENLSDIIYHCDWQGRFTYLTPSASTITGYAEEEVIGMHFSEIIPPESRNAVVSFYLKQYQERRVESYLEFPIMKKDGSIIQLGQRVKIVPRKDGLIEFYVNARDITERKLADEALRASEEKYRLSEEKYRSLVDTGIIGYFEVDLQGNFTFCNKSFIDYLGYPENELIGMNFRQVTDEKEISQIMAEFANIYSGKIELGIVKLKAIRKDGHIVHGDNYVSVRKDDLGNIVGFRSVGINTTDRILAEEALRASEESYRLVVENISDCINICSHDGHFKWVSPSITSLTGFTPEDMEGKHFLHFVKNESRDALLQNLLHQVNAKIPAQYNEFQMITKDGGEIWAGQTTRMIDNNGEIEFFNVSRDVTELKNAEEDLRTSEERYRLVVENIGDCITISPLSGHFKWVSPSVERLIGYKPDEMVGRHFLHFVVDEHRNDLFQAFARQVTENMSVQYNEFQLIKKDGSSLWAGQTSRMIKNSDGEIEFFNVGRDITELKEAQDALILAKEEAETANRAKSAFLANMSHEIRTPMNAILGFSQLMLRDTGITREQHQHLTTINRSGEHLLSLINDILEMSKIEAGRVTIATARFDLQAMLRDIEMMFRMRTEAKGLQFLVEVTETTPRYIISDEGKVRQILINLMGNAVKFTDAGGIAVRVGVSAKEEDRLRLLVEVEDTGLGMDEQDIGMLFQAFQQTESGIKTGGGTGLGLALSKEFARLLGGDITVTSTPGEGSCFRLAIDVHAAQDGETAQPADRGRRVQGLAPGQGPFRVLVVDDKAENRVLLREMLGHVGFEIREAENGEEAIELFKKWQPHLILMDMRMPVMDGYTATKRIKSMKTGKDTPIVALTASAFEEERKKVFEAGTDRYLRKPFKDYELFEIIGSCLDVKYVYEAVALPAEARAEELALSRETLASLPRELASQMISAITNLDLDRLLELIAKVEEYAPAMADPLREMANNYQFDSLQKLFNRRKTT